MIEKIKRLIWKVEGMEYNDTSALKNTSFHLIYGKAVIGTLTYNEGHWSFEYDKDFEKISEAAPIMDFPDMKKKYTSKKLWPFFASRIPAINQPYQIRKIAKAKIDQKDPIALLRLFGKDTITNPFRLLVI